MPTTQRLVLLLADVGVKFVPEAHQLRPEGLDLNFVEPVVQHAEDVRLVCLAERTAVAQLVGCAREPGRLEALRELLPLLPRHAHDRSREANLVDLPQRLGVITHRLFPTVPGAFPLGPHKTGRSYGTGLASG